MMSSEEQVEFEEATTSCHSRIISLIDSILEEELSEDARRLFQHLKSAEQALPELEVEGLVAILLEGLR